MDAANTDSGAERPETRSTAAQIRHAEILDIVRREGRLDVAPGAARLGITPETLRRDLRALERIGHIRRSYGAAFPVESSRFETPLDFRENANSEEKARIADAAAGQIGHAQTIFIDEGFLPQLVARALPDDRPLTVVTASLPAANELAQRREVEVFLLGGRVRGTTLGTVDHWATTMLQSFVIDLAYIGANGISTEHGLTTPDPAVAAVKRAAVAASRQRIFIGTHTKFGVSSFSRFAEIGEFEKLVTGEQLSPHRAQLFSQYGPKVLRV
ncbi:DeoR/GlpR family DNA-binding transcription regulator [Leifsonia sp. NPDC058230]|uniref:DeoR/GlpR family DNA-binding transcription regulator n=1 Tax=Leifsonia sp. NPDC058230 TaxID=3346391 RepID=UPI0036D91DC9